MVILANLRVVQLSVEQMVLVILRLAFVNVIRGGKDHLVITNLLKKSNATIDVNLGVMENAINQLDNVYVSRGTLDKIVNHKNVPLIVEKMVLVIITKVYVTVKMDGKELLVIICPLKKLNAIIDVNQGETENVILQLVNVSVMRVLRELIAKVKIVSVIVEMEDVIQELENVVATEVGKENLVL